MRQLNNYNLSVYGFHDKKGYNYLWNETIARRGASDIASCMMRYLEWLNRSGSIKTVKLLSDSAGGQNRNRPFMAMLWWAAQHFDFEEILHVFFVRGHSENVSDSIHARIEAASKHVDVYTTPQWATVIQGAKRNAPHYKVTGMVMEDFWDFKSMTKEFINMNKTTDRENAKFLQIRMYSVRKSDPIVTIKYSMNARPVEMNLFQSSRRSADMNPSLSPKAAYSAPLGIDSRKIKDLLAM